MVCMWLLLWEGPGGNECTRCSISNLSGLYSILKRRGEISGRRSIKSNQTLSINETDMNGGWSDGVMDMKKVMSDGHE